MTPHQVIQAIIDAGVKGDLKKAEMSLGEHAIDFAIFVSGYDTLLQCKKFFHCKTSKELYDKWANNQLITQQTI